MNCNVSLAASGKSASFNVDVLVEQAQEIGEEININGGSMVAVILQECGRSVVITSFTPEEAKTLAHKLLVIAKRIQGV